MIVFFTLPPPPGNVSVNDIIHGIRELLFVGTYDLPKQVLDAAKRYDGTEAWETLWWLGKEHTGPFNYCNGVVQTWSKYTFNQAMCIRSFGEPLPSPHTQQHCA